MSVHSVLSRILPSFIQTKLEGSASLRKIIENISWLFADKIFRMGGALFVGVWIARYLGPEQFGLFNYAGAFVALFSVLSTLGLDGIVVRDIVNKPANKNAVLGSAFLIKLIGSFVTFFLVVGTIFFLRPGDKTMASLVAVFAVGNIFSSFYVIDFWFQSQIKSKYTVYARNIPFILVSLGKIGLILYRAPLIAFVWAIVVELALHAVGFAYFYHKTGERFRAWQFDYRHAVRLLRVSWPLILSQMAIMIYMKIDQVMLGDMSGAASVGIYSAAVRISEIWYFIPVVIVSSLTPSIIAVKHNETLYYERMQKLFNFMTGLFYVIALPITLLSGWITVTLYGVKYAAAGPVLAIHIWAGLFVFLGVARQVWIINEGFTKSALLTTSCGALINVLLNLILIPRYAEIGAAIATVVAYAFADYFFSILYRPFRKIGIAMTKAVFMQGLFNYVKLTIRRIHES
jgi:PST family polysaccharide transporter